MWKRATNTLGICMPVFMEFRVFGYRLERGWIYVGRFFEKVILTNVILTLSEAMVLVLRNDSSFESDITFKISYLLHGTYGECTDCL